VQPNNDLAHPPPKGTFGGGQDDSGGLAKLHFDYRATSKNALLAERRSWLPVPRTLRGPLETVLGDLK